MLYTADVNIEQSISAFLMAMPSEERLTCTSGLIENHEYEQMDDVSIDDAIEIISDEAELLARIEAIPEKQQEEKLEEIYDELREDCHLALLGLDLGVAGLVNALAAIGCVTISSCNGGVMGDDHPMHHPWIIFHAPINLVDLLTQAAEETGAGLVNTDNGMLEAYSDDIWKFNRMANHLITRYNNDSISGF